MLPEEVRETLHEHDLREANEMYGMAAGDTDFAGALADGGRYRFVDVRDEARAK